MVSGFAAARAAQHEHVVVQTALPGVGFDFGMGGEQGASAVCEARVARVGFVHEARFHGGVGPRATPGFGCVFDEGFEFGDFHKALLKRAVDEWGMRLTCSFARDAGSAGREECGRRGRWCDSWEKRASDLAPRWAAAILRCVTSRSVLGRAALDRTELGAGAVRMTTVVAARIAATTARRLEFANHAVGQMRGNGFFGLEIRVAGRVLEHALERHAGMLGYDLRGYVPNAHQIVGTRLH